MDKKLLGIIIGIAVILSLCFISALTRYEYLYGQDNQDGCRNNQMLAQNFTIGTVGTNVTFNNTQIGLLLAIAGSPTANLTVDIVSTLTGTSLGHGETDANGLGAYSLGNCKWKNITIISNANLTKGGMYYIRLNSSTDPSNDYKICANYTSVYAGGEGWKSSNGGDTWSAVGTGRAYDFEVYGGELATSNLSINSTIPSNNATLINGNIDFYCTYTGVTNVSFWTNSTGTWSINQTVTHTPTSTLKDYFNTTYDDDYWSLGDTFWKAMTFTAGSTYNLGMISIDTVSGYNNSRIVASIRDTSGEFPTGADLTVNSTGVDCDGWCNITLPSISLTSGRVYAIVLRTVDSAKWKVNYSGGYSGGRWSQSADSGASWNNLADPDVENSDFLFKIYGASGTNGTDKFTLSLRDTNINWTCSGCDSLGCSFAPNRTLKVTNYAINSQTYVKNTTSYATNPFTLNVSYDSSGYTVSADIIYNGTTYAGTKTGTGNDAIFTAYAIAPFVTSTQNVSWYWRLGLNSGGTTYYSTENKSHGVSNITIDDCSVNSIVIYNFTIRDEATKSILNATNNTYLYVDLSLSPYGTSNKILNYSKTFNLTNPNLVCTNKDFGASQYRVDMTADYNAIIDSTHSYVTKFYYKSNETLVNSSMPYLINLYDLPTDDSTTFLFTFKDSTGLTVPNGIVHVYRYYIGDGLYREVERGKLDNNGETHLHLVEEDVIYYFTVTLYDRLLYTSDSYNAKCLSTPCSIELSAQSTTQEFPTDWDLVNNTAYDITYNRTARTVSLSFVSTEVTIANFTLYKFNNNNATLVNMSSLTGASGTITLHVPIVYGNTTFFTVTYFNNTYVRSDWVSFQQSGIDYFGTTGVILASLIIIALIFMTIGDGAVTIVAGIFALALTGILKLIDLNWYAFISIAVFGAIIIYKLMGRGN